MIARIDGIPMRLIKVLEDFFSDIVQSNRERKFTGTLKLIPNRLINFNGGGGAIPGYNWFLDIQYKVYNLNQIQDVYIPITGKISRTYICRNANI